MGHHSISSSTHHILIEEAIISGRIQFPAPEHLLPLSRTILQSREEMSPTNAKNPRFALDQADDTMKWMVLTVRSSTWEGAVGRIKWVMDTLGPAAEVRVLPFRCP